MITNIAAVIPCYCPDIETSKVVEAMLLRFEHVIVVDDGSPEASQPLFNSFSDRVSLIQHNENQGKGAAIKSAIKFCANLPVIGIITVDADGQHLPEDVDKVAEFAMGAPAAFVLGVRNFSKNVPLRSKFGNEMTLAVLRVFYGLSLSDSQTGLRFIPANLFYDLLSLPGDRYEFELQCLLMMHRRKVVIAQVPIQTVYLDENKSSHFRPIRDSIKIYSVFLKFSISSTVCFALDIVLFSILFALSENVWGATIVSRSVSGVANFAINRGFVFNQTGKKSLVANACQYGALWLSILLMSASSVDFLKSFGDSSLVVPIKITVDLILFFLSYKVQKNYIFR